MKIKRSFLVISSLFLSISAASAQSTVPALTAYYGVKNALVATDAAKAKTQAVRLASALGKMDAAKLPTADQKALALAKSSATTISKTADVGKQRKAFVSLSSSMIALAKATKPAKTYVQYCPMVKASWLSERKEVRNPYYGNEMLTCGKTNEVIE